MRSVILLGPQRLKPNLVEEVDRLDVHGSIAAVTAGWQERESEDEELRDHLQRPVVNLMLHERCEQVFSEDEELFRAARQRQDLLREMQQLYRYRLDFVLEPARELLRRQGPAPLISPEQEAAIEAARNLDREHLDRIAAVHHDFERRWWPMARPAVARHRQEISETLASCAALAVAGGHVATLLNRLRLFGVLDLLPAHHPVFAWSAGAMALSEQVVLFHDLPPQGAGNTEVFEIGLGVFQGLLPFPHARRRLHLGDPARVELLARRFAPRICAPLDEGASITWDRGIWRPEEGSLCLDKAGCVIPWEAA